MGSIKFCYRLNNNYVSGVKESEIEDFKFWFKRNKEYIKNIVCLVEGKCYVYTERKWKEFKEKGVWKILVNSRDYWNCKYKD